MSTTNKISARKLAMAIVLVVIMFTSLFFCGFAIKKASAISGSWSDSGNYDASGLTKDAYGYYIVSSPEVFARCNKYSGTYYETGTKIKLMANLDMSAHYWVPWDYHGDFDGNGFTISGIKTTPPTSGSNSQYNNCGLFSGLIGATVKNLKLKDFEINGVVCAGALAGYSENSTITNIKVGGETTIKTENVSLTSMSGNLHTGGICGATKNNSTIQDCWVEDCKIYSSNTLSNAKYNGSYPLSLAGGISGWVDDTGCKIQRCRSLNNSIYTYNPDLSIKKMYVSNSYAGGIAGEALGTGGISQCENSSNVYGGVRMDNIAIDNTMAGGIVGRAVNCPITACINSGNISGYTKNGTIEGTSVSQTAIGSQVLNKSGELKYGDYGCAINKTNNGWGRWSDDTSRSTASKTPLYATSFFGGIVGYNSKSNVSYCYNTGTISTINSKNYERYNYKFIGHSYLYSFSNGTTNESIMYEVVIYYANKLYTHSICGYYSEATISNCCTKKNALSSVKESETTKVEVFREGTKILTVSGISSTTDKDSSAYNDIQIRIKTVVYDSSGGRNIQIRGMRKSEGLVGFTLKSLTFNNTDKTDDATVGIEVGSGKLSSAYYATDDNINGGLPYLKCFYWKDNTVTPSWE